MNLTETKKNNVFEKKYWDYNRYKPYYKGLKVYICTKWDNSNKINFNHYGKIIDINETFVTINVGKYKGYIDLIKTLTYSNNEIKIELKSSQNSESIEKILQVNSSNNAIEYTPYILPSSDGTSGQILQTDGSGTVSFVSIDTSFIGAAEVLSLN